MKLLELTPNFLHICQNIHRLLRDYMYINILLVTPVRYLPLTLYHV